MIRRGPRSSDVGASVDDQLTRFVEALFEPTDIVEIRRLPSRRSTSCRASELPSLAATLQTENDAGQNIYIGANPRTRKGGTKAEDVATCRSLVADFDNVTFDETRNLWENAGLPPPTVVVNTGHGVHAYWRLSEPIDPATWTQWQKDLIAAVGSDPAIQDPPRIVRVPGFTNHKAPVAESCLVEADPTRTYDLADLQNCIPHREPEPTPEIDVTPKATATGLARLRSALAYLSKIPGAVEGDHGDARTFGVACVLVNDFDLSVEQAWPLFAEWNRTCSPQWDEKDLRQKLDNAVNHAKRPKGNKVNATTPATATAGTGPDTAPDPPPTAWVTIDDVMKLKAYPEGMPTVSTGLPTLDELMSGGPRSECVTIIAGRTASAKSHLAGNIVRLTALDGINVLFFTLEDSPIIAVWRIHAAAANTPTEVLLAGLRGQHGPGVDALRSAYPVLADLPLRLTDVRDVATIGTLVRQHKDQGGELVVIDQLSKISAPHLPANTTRYELTNQVSESLRLAAVEHRIAIVVIVQVNREASKREGALELYDLRDSGMLEQDAAAVLLIGKATDPPTTSVQEKPFCKLLPIRLAKQRFGPAGKTVELLWYPRIGRIEDFVEERQR